MRDIIKNIRLPIDGKPIVLFLDELNRARPEILQTIMDLALNRTLAGRALPDGSRIITSDDIFDYMLSARINNVEIRKEIEQGKRSFVQVTY